MRIYQKKFVERCLRLQLSSFDLSVSQDIIANVLDDVIQDIEETADEDFNDSDVSIALGRVLCQATSTAK